MIFIRLIVNCCMYLIKIMFPNVFQLISSLFLHTYQSNIHFTQTPKYPLKLMKYIFYINLLIWQEMWMKIEETVKSKLLCNQMSLLKFRESILKIVQDATILLFMNKGGPLKYLFLNQLNVLHSVNYLLYSLKDNC